MIKRSFAMHYLFVFLVALNASYLGYQLLKENDPSALQPIANVTRQDFPVTLKLVSQRTLLDQIESLSLKSHLSLSALKPSTS
jgi:hypothetical protein